MLLSANTAHSAKRPSSPLALLDTALQVQEAGSGCSRSFLNSSGRRIVTRSGHQRVVIPHCNTSAAVP